MRKFSVLLFAFILLNNLVSFAQDDEKKLRKEWAKKVKTMDPLEVKKLMEDKAALEGEKHTLNSKISDLESKVKAKEEQNRTLASQLDSLKSLNTTTVSSVTDNSAANQTTTAIKTAPSTKVVQNSNPTQANTSSEDGKVYQADKIGTKGIIFKVQIGAFKNKDLSKYFDNNKNFSGDVDSDGQHKYTLGYFKDYWEADNFKKALREMGATEAWVVAYKNGQRVNIKDVLEGTVD